MGETEKALELGKQLTKGVFGTNAEGLNALAWEVVDPSAKEKRDPKAIQFAIETAKHADDLAKGKEPGIADTLAKAYFDSGQKAKALETQERAVKLARGTPFENNKEMIDRLEQYRKAVKD